MRIVLLTVALLCSGAAQLVDVNRLKDDLSGFLGKPRFSEEEKDEARSEISRIFREMNLTYFEQSFIAEEKGSVGTNVIALSPGPYFGTAEDSMVVLVANYDTEEDIAGVDDNGSGVAGALETARVLTALSPLYPFNSTLLYAIVDQKHQGLAGSHAFVEEVLLEIIDKEKVRGVFVLDGLLHFDPFPTSQAMPKGFEDVFPAAAKQLSEHNTMGDFIQVTGRKEVDTDVMQSFVAAFTRASSQLAPNWAFQPWVLPLQLPLNTVSSLSDIYRLHPYLFADHSSFYFHSRPKLVLPTIHITDTHGLRGVRQYCPQCDGRFLLSSSNLDFLSLVVDAVVRSVVLLAESSASQFVDDLQFLH